MNLSLFSKSSVNGFSRRPRYRFLLGILTAVFFALVCTVRLVPVPWSDRAIFISVAEYLRSGSRLYVDIYDNKDPLFFYAVAVQRMLGPFGEYLFELLMVAIATLSTVSIAHATKITDNTHRKLLLVAVPLLVTGNFWEPGMTHLPATALSLLAITFFLKNRMLLAGGSIGLVALTKLIMLPLPAVFCLTYEFVLQDRKASYRHIRSAVAGFALVLGMMAAFLLATHNLIGYLQAQQNNFFYSQSVLVDNRSFSHSFISHLRTVFFGSYEKLALLLSFVAGMIFCGRSASSNKLNKETRAFSIGTVTTGVMSVVVLGLTGIWEHHLQLIYFVQTLVLVCVAFGLRTQKSFTSVVSGGTLLLLAVLLGGTLSLSQYDGASSETLSKLSYLSQTSPEIAAFRTLYPSGTGFARLGQNTSVMPYGATNDTLLCPDFAQYPFYSAERLSSILSCIKAAPTLVVDHSFEHLEEAPDWWPRESQKQVMLNNWNEFVAEGEKLIEAQYTCKQIEYVRICNAIEFPGTKTW